MAETSRYQAALIHLAISAAVLVVVLLLVFLAWYPPPTFTVTGAIDIVTLLVAAQVVVAPLLTLIVYRQGKRGMLFDLWFIGILQAAALLYGSWALYIERPYYLVFAVDRYVLTPEWQIDKSMLYFDHLRDKPFGRLVPVFARLPEDPDELDRFRDSVLFGGARDLEARPEYWEPYAAGEAAIRERAIPVDAAALSNREREVLAAGIARHSADHPALGLIPVFTREDDMSLLVDLDTLEPVTALAIDTWASKPQVPSPDND
jgi:hypothetical protein